MAASATAVAVMDCRNWDEDAYRESILQQRETLCRTVFRTAFPLNPTSSSKIPDLIVTACSDGSIASYSISSCLVCHFYLCVHFRSWSTKTFLFSSFLPVCKFCQNLCSTTGILIFFLFVSFSLSLGFQVWRCDCFSKVCDRHQCLRCWALFD